MRIKVKPSRVVLEDNKLYKEEMVYVMRDDFGEVLREQYHPFSNAKKEKKRIFVGTVEDAPF